MPNPTSFKRYYTPTPTLDNNEESDLKNRNTIKTISDEIQVTDLTLRLKEISINDDVPETDNSKGNLYANLYLLAIAISYIVLYLSKKEEERTIEDSIQDSFEDKLFYLFSPEKVGDAKLIEKLHHFSKSYDCTLLGGYQKRVYKLTKKDAQSKVKSIAVARIQVNSSEDRISGSIAEKSIDGTIPMGILRNRTRDEAIIVTKYCNKGSLLYYRFKLTPEERITALITIWDSLASFHDAGYSHRDFYARNVFVHEKKDGTLRYYLADFGESSRYGIRGKSFDYRGMGIIISQLFYVDGSKNTHDIQLKNLSVKLQNKADDITREEVSAILHEFKNNINNREYPFPDYARWMDDSGWLD